MINYYQANFDFDVITLDDQTVHITEGEVVQFLNVNIFYPDGSEIQRDYLILLE